MVKFNTFCEALQWFFHHNETLQWFFHHNETDGWNYVGVEVGDNRRYVLFVDMESGFGFHSIKW